MALRLYILPTVTNARGFLAPAYITSQENEVQTYATEGYCLCAAEVTPAEHSAIAANVDAVAFPADLSQTLTAGQVTTVKNAMENRGIPNAGITTATTWLQVMKRILRLFRFSWRMLANGSGRILPPGVTLDTPYSSLSQAAKTRLKAAADSYGMDTSSLSAASTVREILHALAEQEPTPFVIRGQVFE